MYEELKHKVYESNLLLPKYELVTLTWGNVSEIDRYNGVIGIKPSGVSYDKLQPDDIVILDLNGKIIEGHLKPSSDTPTHLILYQNFKEIRGVVHTHSKYATVFSQAHKDISCYGTTHADTFNGSIPLTRDLTPLEVENQYEKNTGKVIIEHFKNEKINPGEIPGVLVSSHGPFCWGTDSLNAVENAVTLEAIAEMNILTKTLNTKTKEISSYLLQKHFERKHGDCSYYGQA